MDELKLTDFISPQMLQNIQDTFAGFTGMAILMTDADGEPLTECSNFSDFCIDIVCATKAGMSDCQSCRRTAVKECKTLGKPTLYECRSGMTSFFAPIIIRGRIVGSIIGGQVRTKDHPDSVLREKALSIGADPKEYIAKFRETAYLTEEHLEKTAEFLTKLATLLSDFAYSSYIATKNCEHTEASATSRISYMSAIYSVMQIDIQDIITKAKRAMVVNDPDVHMQLLERIVGIASQRLSGISDTLGYIDRYTGALTLDEDIYEPQKLVDSVVQTSGLLNEKNGNTIAASYSGEICKSCFGDIERIKNLLINLIKNADELSHGSEIKIIVSCKIHEYATMLCFEIKYSCKAFSDGMFTEFKDYIKSGCGGADADLTAADILIRQLGGCVQIGCVYNSGEDVKIMIPQLSA